MDDIRRQDLRLFSKELLSPVRLLVTLAIVFAIFGLPIFFVQQFLAAVVVLSSFGLMAWNDSIRRRWLDRRMAALWEGVRDRLNRFEEVLKKMRRDQIADLSEMPQTIRGVATSIYSALRRADMIAHEVQLSERGLYATSPNWSSPSNDAQSKELYRIADKNIAEYRQQFVGLIAGVQRTEAQAAVFMTTVDTLRMKMLGYRLVGRSPELSSNDFLSALAEARAQLQSIDTALEELDLGHYPKTISVVPNTNENLTPPPVPPGAIPVTSVEESNVQEQSG